jgi:hypothetical protein
MDAVKNYLECVKLRKKVDITPMEYLDLPHSHSIPFEVFKAMIETECMSLDEDSYEFRTMRDLIEIRSWIGIASVFFPIEDLSQITIFELGA